MEEFNRAKQIKEQEEINENLFLLQKIEEETQRQKAKMEMERQKRKQLKFKASQELKKFNDDNSMQFTTINFDSLIMLDPDDSQVFIIKKLFLNFF